MWCICRQLCVIHIWALSGRVISVGSVLQLISLMAGVCLPCAFESAAKHTLQPTDCSIKSCGWYAIPLNASTVCIDNQSTLLHGLLPVYGKKVVTQLTTSLVQDGESLPSKTSIVMRKIWKCVQCTSAKQWLHTTSVCSYDRLTLKFFFTFIVVIFSFAYLPLSRHAVNCLVEILTSKLRCVMWYLLSGKYYAGLNHHFMLFIFSTLDGVHCSEQSLSGFFFRTTLQGLPVFVQLEHMSGGALV